MVLFHPCGNDNNNPQQLTHFHFRECVCRDVCCFYVEIMEMRVYHNHISYSHSIRTVLLPLCISLAYFHQPPLVTPYTSEERLITWQSVCCCLPLLNFNEVFSRYNAATQPERTSESELSGWWRWLTAK
jgi:hypothetical protein